MSCADFHADNGEPNECAKGFQSRQIRGRIIDEQNFLADIAFLPFMLTPKAYRWFLSPARISQAERVWAELPGGKTSIPKPYTPEQILNEITALT